MMKIPVTHTAPTQALSIGSLVGVHRAVANRPAFVSGAAVESEIGHVIDETRFVPPERGLKESYARTLMGWMNGKRRQVYASPWTVRQSLAQDMRTIKALLDHASFDGARLDEDDLKGLKRALARTKAGMTHIRRRRMAELSSSHSIKVYLGIIEQLTGYARSQDVFTRAGIETMARLIEEPMQAGGFLGGLTASMHHASTAVAPDLPLNIFSSTFSLVHVVEDAMNVADKISAVGEPVLLNVRWNESVRTMTIDTEGDERLWNVLRDNPAATLVYRNEKTNWHVRGNRLIVPVGSVRLFEFWERIIAEVWQSSAALVPLIMRVARGESLDKSSRGVWHSLLDSMASMVEGLKRGDAEGLLNVLGNMVIHPSNYREALIKELVGELRNTLTPFAVLDQMRDNAGYVRRVAQRMIGEHGIPRSMLPFERLFEIYGYFREGLNVMVDVPETAVIPRHLYETNLLLDRVMWCAAGIADEGVQVSLAIEWDERAQAIRIRDEGGDLARMLGEIERFAHLFPKPMATIPRVAAWVSDGRGLVREDDHTVVVPLGVV